MLIFASYVTNSYVVLINHTFSNSEFLCVFVDLLQLRSFLKYENDSGLQMSEILLSIITFCIRIISEVFMT